ncbi:MAG: hypothetical protein HZA02_09715 [Nitrospinae bacterium]|nr:hypothetical protein [Nitrospinota bacterium]
MKKFIPAFVALAFLFTVSAMKPVKVYAEEPAPAAPAETKKDDKKKKDKK